MAVVFKNNAKTTLASGLTSSATSVTVADGSTFPSLSGGNTFFCTFDNGTNVEVVKVTARSSNTLTIVRAQDDTTARAFSTGDVAELRLTAGILNLFSQTGVAVTDEIEAYLDANGTTFPDNVKAQFGTGSDLQIYHDGSDSYIKNDTGRFRIFGAGGNVAINVDAGSNNAVSLEYANSTKLKTTGSGVSMPYGATFGNGGDTILENSQPGTSGQKYFQARNSFQGGVTNGSIFGGMSFLRWGGTGHGITGYIRGVANGTSGNMNLEIITGTAGSLTQKVLIKDAGVDITGNIGVTGTVDGVDIAARDAILTSTTTTANAALPKAGGTMTGNIAHASNFTIDAGGDIILDADGGDVIFRDAGAAYGKLTNGSGSLHIVAQGADNDIKFYGNDGGSSVLALTLDMSAAGAATFNGTVTATGGNSTNWNTAYGWGNHASAGYLTSHQSLSAYLLNTTDTFAGNLTFIGGNNSSKESFINVKRGNASGLWLKFQTDGTSANNVNQFVIRRSTDSVDILNLTATNGNIAFVGSVTASGGNSGNWNTAYGWGNHASASYATQSYVGTQISNLVDSSPAALNTLNELAAALGDDANFSTTVNANIATKLPKAGGTMSGVLNMGSQNITNASDIGMATGHSSGKFAVMATSVHGSYDFYNNGTSYFNGNVIVDANLTLSSGGQILGSPDITAGRVVTSGLYGTGHNSSILPIWQFNAGNPGYGIGYYEGNPDNIRFSVSGNLMSGTPDFLISNNTAQINGNTVWHAGNDGSGSGLDADLLDGQHGSYYAPASHVHSYLPVNNPTATGTLVSPIIRARKSQTQGNYTTAALWTESFSSTNTGIAFHISGNVGKMLDMRTDGHLYWENGRVWSATSDGSGSGLDADLLDGQQGSFYRNASNIDAGTLPIARLPSPLNSSQAHAVTGSAFATTSSPGSVLEYQQAASITDTKLAPSGDWHNTIRMGHGNPYSYYSNTIAIRMTGSGLGDLYTQTISNNSAQGWNKHWHNNNDGSGSGLDADLLDGQQGSYYLNAANFTGTAPTGSPFLSNFVHLGTSTATGYATDDGTWGSRLNVSSTVHAKIEVSQEANSMRSAWYAHTGQTGIKFGTTTSHVVDFITAGTVRMSIPSNSGLVTTTGQGTLWGTSNDGSGSGLDADLLDGNHASAFLTASPTSITIDGAQDQVISTTTHSLEIKNMGATGSGGLVLQGSSGTHGLQMYWDTNGAYYGFLDAAWANWDIQKARNGAFKVDEGSGLQRVWNAGNDGSGSGLDADLLDGYHASTTYNAANTVPIRDANGYLNLGYINTNIGTEALSHDWTKVYASTDNYIRPYGKSDFKVRMGLTAHEYDRMDYATATQYHTGANSHNDTTFNGLLQRGCGFIDNWNGGAGKPPTGSHFNGFQSMHYGNGSSYFHGMQMAMAAGNPSNTFLRGWWANGGSGYGWQKIWTDGNDGSGSGLDADLLDGVNSASFARVDAGSTYTNYGNLQRFYSNTNMATASGSQASLECFSNGSGNDAFMTFHVGSDYAIYLGLDGGTNKLSTGGWSAGAVSHEIYHAGNKPSLATLGYTGATNANYITNNNQLTNGAAYLTNSSSHAISYVYRIHASDSTSPDSFGYDNRYQTFNYGVSSGIVGPLITFGGLGSGYPMQLTGNYSSSGTGIKYRTRNGDTASWNSWYTLWHNGNDGSGSGLDADLLDGLNAKGVGSATGASQVLTSNTNSYFVHQNWIDIGASGIYSTSTNGAHFTPNAVTNYGTWKSSGSRGGYDGIVFAGGGSTALMFDSGGNGGMYRQGGVGWYTYFNGGNDCLGVCDSTTSSSYSLYVTGAIYSTGNITAYSDKRVKENIVTIDNALEKVNGLQGVYYNRIDDENKTKEIGFIAQEVNEVVPELVTYAEDVDQYGVKYGNTTALLVEAVKELTQQVKDLKQEIEEIKNAK